MCCDYTLSGGLGKGSLAHCSMRDHYTQCFNDSNEIGQEIHFGPVRNGTPVRSPVSGIERIDSGAFLQDVAQGLCQIVHFEGLFKKAVKAE